MESQFVLKVKKLRPDAIIPTKAYIEDAGFDLYMVEDPTKSTDITYTSYLCGNSSRIYYTGIAVEIPVGYYGRIADRSSVASKKHVHVMGGVIDSGYRGELMILMHNMSFNNVTLNPGEKIAQLIIEKIAMCTVEVADELSSTERNTGGFGSTGGGISVDSSVTTTGNILSNIALELPAITAAKVIAVYTSENAKTQLPETEGNQY